jgi:hypothetical protein
MQRIEIMRPGRFRAMNGAEISFTEDNLRLAAVAYDAAKAPAPVVIGHPTTDAPAYGWVKGMDFADGTLGAYVGDLEASFADAVKARRYNKVSASFFAPQQTSNPRPGVFYLKHVGFLGATAPAVPGLKPVSFAADAGDCLEFAHEADAMGMRDAEATATGRALARVAELEARDRKNQVREVAEFCDGLVTQRRLPHGLRDLAFAALAQAPEGATVSFGEGEAAATMTQREALMRLLSALPAMVMLGEFGGRGGAGAASGPDDLPLPEGYSADPDREALARRAEAIRATRGIPYAEAVRMAAREAAP